MKKVFQHVDEYRIADGVGGDVYSIYKILQSLGVETKVVCRLSTFPESPDIIFPDEASRFSANDIHIYHYGGAGYPLEYFLSLNGKKILRYHNVTPAEFFLGAGEDIYKSMRKFEITSFLELNEMKNRIDLVLSGSLYNAESLKEIGYNRIQHLPIVRKYTVAAKSRKVEKKIGFIGRMVPNKKYEDFLKVFYLLQKIDPEYKAVLIGSVHKAFARYYEKIQKLIVTMGLQNSVIIKSGISEEEKNSELQSWTAYVSMSEHEGFGIPLLESFAAGVPVVSFKSSGIPETLRKGGILIRDKQFNRIAALVEVLHSNVAFRKKIIQNQFRALDFYLNYPFENKLRNIIETV